MRSQHSAYPQQQNGMFFGGGGDGAISHVQGQQLKQVDVPVETLLGFANGALNGAIFGAIGSGIATYAKEGGHNILKQACGNIMGAHLLPVLACTTALGAMGALVRYSRATKHNEWSEKHYQFMNARNNASAEPDQKPTTHVQADHAQHEHLEEKQRQI